MDNISVETPTTDWRPDEPQGPDVGLTLNAILKVIFYSVALLLGLFGNSLILRVYWSKPNKTSSHILIMGLAGMDLTVCIMRVYNIIVFILFLANMKTPAAVKYIGVIALMNLYASSVLTCFIAVDRYDCVCRPNNRRLNRRRAKLMIFGSYAGAMLITSPRIVEAILLPAFIPLQNCFLIFQCVLYILLLAVICVCYGQVYMTIRKHVKVNALSKRHGNHDFSATTRASSSQHAGIPAIAGKVPIALPSTKDKGLPFKSNRPGSSEMIGRQAPVPKEAFHRDDQSMTATKGNVNITPTDRPPGNVNPNQPRGKCETVSLQRKTTKMMFGTSVVLLVTWFPYWLYIALALAKVNGSVISPLFEQVVFYSTPTVYLNNILNPLIYGLANRRFRKDCLSTLKKIKRC